MLDTEYNEAEVMELFKEDGRKEGREEGREEGIIATIAILRGLKLDDTTICEKISEQYHLTAKQVKKYL